MKIAKSELKKIIKEELVAEIKGFEALNDEILNMQRDIVKTLKSAYGANKNYRALKMSFEAGLLGDKKKHLRDPGLDVFDEEDYMQKTRAFDMMKQSILNKISSDIKKGSPYRDFERFLIDYENIFKSEYNKNNRSKTKDELRKEKDKLRQAYVDKLKPSEKSSDQVATKRAIPKKPSVNANALTLTSDPALAQTQDLPEKSKRG